MTDPAMGDGFGFLGALLLLPALATTGFVPGWAAAGALGVREPFSRSGLAVLLSALVTFLVGTASLAFTRGVGAGATLLTAVSAALVAGAMFAGRGRGLRVRWSWSAAAVVAWTALVLGVYAANPELRHRVDGWFHGAVTARIVAAGLPPDDPYFAGLRLNYPWAWHVLLATTAQAGTRFGVSAFDAMAGWSTLAALSLGAWLVVVGRAWALAAGLGATLVDRAGAAAVALAVVGTNPLGAAFWLVRGLAGNEGGAAELARPLGGGATEAMLATTWRLPHVSLATLVDKFLTPTAFGLAEASVLAFGALALFGAAPADARRRFALLAGVALVALLVHGASGIAVLIVALAAALFGGRPGRTVLAALALAAALAAPYLWLTQGSWTRGRVAPALQPDMLLAIVLVGGLVIALAAREALRRPRPDGAMRALLPVAGVLLALAASASMVQRNETKLVNLALVLLSVPAAVGLVRMRPAAGAALLALLVPTHALAVAGFGLDRGQDTPGRRVPPPALREAYAWIGQHTRPEDVFLEALPAGARDPDRDLVVHGPRAIVWGGLGYASNWGYSGTDLGWRRAAAAHLGEGQLSALDIEDLEAAFDSKSGRTLYLVHRGVVPDSPTAPGGSHWTRVFANDSLALDRLDSTGPLEDRPRARSPR